MLVRMATAANRLQFDRYLLDLQRGCLLLDGKEVALRPKTFGVLRYMAENAGRLVSKEDLLGAVWPGLVVTDDTLVQSIGELRRALGDDRARFIRTVPRRGYRFEAEVSPIAEASAPATLPSEPSPRRRSKVVRLAPFAALAVAVLFAVSIGIGLRAPDRAGAGTAKAAIAILPLKNESPDATRAYFAEGLTQDIITAMGRFPELTVMSWNAVQGYGSNAAPPSRVAHELGVRYQVEGSVLQDAGRVRVNARLVDAEGRVHWAGRFDERVADLFALQDRMTREIAGALAVNVGRIEETRAASKLAASPEAYDYVLRARSQMHQPTRAGGVQARELLRQAIDLDPTSAPAHAALADAYFAPVVMGWAESPAQSLARAEEMAHKALALDASQARAHVVLGRIHLLHHRYPEADAELRRALAINPSDAYAMAGRGNVLMWTGETRAAIETLEQAQRIDPAMSAIDRIALGLAYYLDGRYDRAIEQLEMNLPTGSGVNPSRVILAAAYARQGRADDAARMAANVRRLDPTFDPAAFGSKLRNPAQLEELRIGLRKAGLL
ncbi:MAG TPA: winged helix-turn-helix domain-containing protein [Usitatibacter sp.]|nr:winged helix-turn-helix domain-containing protein [Usitatibacter sp.]